MGRHCYVRKLYLESRTAPTLRSPLSITDKKNPMMDSDEQAMDHYMFPLLHIKACSGQKHTAGQCVVVTLARSLSNPERSNPVPFKFAPKTYTYRGLSKVNILYTWNTSCNL
jgi:hypothetical protein